MKLKKLLSGIFIASVAFTCVYAQMNHHIFVSAANSDVIKMRIVNTTDVHGQLKSKDYSKGSDAKNMGLSRIYTMIKQLKAERPTENVVTLDAGDFIYDYTTESIYAESPYETQPILKAMAYIGYDAITLGNHEFDYGYEYLLQQLNSSGLHNITVVSNLVDSKTGEYPFHENMLLIRQMETEGGKKVEVKIGIIGETIPTLTSKTHSYAGILKTEDIVESTKTQAKKLKGMGADIIIALAHTGIGPENPELNYKNVAYALTKIDEVDVIVCGHEHNEFPTKDASSPYLKLPEVDTKTFLINGKNVVMAADRGRAIGVVDLTLELVNGKIEIVNRNTRLEHVSEENSEENPYISSLYGEWEEKFDTYASEIIGEIADGYRLHNYFGLIGDSKAIQLLNNAKRNFAQYQIQTNAKEYVTYPIIAASTYASYGINSYEDYINLSSKITEADLGSIQPYNNYLYVYEITGEQLKEWLEWSASAYETIGADYELKDKEMQFLIESSGLRPLLSEEWINDWSSFFIFDGIEYEIDPSFEPRYNIAGTKISDSNRITSLSYNGKKIEDTDVFMLATNKITKPVEANEKVANQAVIKGFYRSQAVLGNYISLINASGRKIAPEVDHNWSIKLPATYKFMIKLPSYAGKLFEDSKWYEDALPMKGEYSFYIASLPIEEKDTQAPMILITPLKTKLTGSKYSVAVSATDASKLAYLRYRVGDIELDYLGWHNARELDKNNTFLVHNNGIYTVYAEDIHGNKTVKTISISNISDEVHVDPAVDTYTNRKTKISGTAEPNTTIYFECQGKTYHTEIGASGTFSYSLPAQPSGSTVIVYTRDNKTGKASAEIEVLVKRTGPNAPTIYNIYNDYNYISGTLNDDDADIIFLYDEFVYVNKAGGKQLYMQSELYDANKQIVEIDIGISGSGDFLAIVPPMFAGKTITAYNIDHINRISRKVTAKVTEVGPDAPMLYDITNIENILTGYVPNAKKIEYEIKVEVGGSSYITKSDKSGNFTLTIDEQLYAGQEIYVTAYDMVNKQKRASLRNAIAVKNIEDYVNENSTILTLKPITTKSNSVGGIYLENAALFVAVTTGKGKAFKSTVYSVEPNVAGRFAVSLPEQLTEGTVVYAMTRFMDGRIILCTKVTVEEGRPDIPSFIGGINNSNKTVLVSSFKDCKVELTVGDMVYTQNIYQYNENYGTYVYTFEIDRVNSGTKVTLVATNNSGTSEKLTTSVEKIAPDAPTVKKVKVGGKAIRGKIELLSTEEETTVYAKIGKKTYQGIVNEYGYYEIEVPEIEEDSNISVYGKLGDLRGPLTKVTPQASAVVHDLDED